MSDNIDARQQNDETTEDQVIGAAKEFLEARREGRELPKTIVLKDDGKKLLISVNWKLPVDSILSASITIYILNQATPDGTPISEPDNFATVRIAPGSDHSHYGVTPHDTTLVTLADVARYIETATQQLSKKLT